MRTQVVAITQPYIRTEDNTRFLDTEEFIVYCARVSNPNNQLNVHTGTKLLEYCIKHEHWSIFEQASMTVEIETSRDISAQIIRHKSFCFQEFSQRYSEVMGYESFDVRKQAEKNRQSSVEVLDLTDEEINQIQQHLVNGDNLYKYLLKKGAAKESARKLLPLCSKTTLYMTGSIRSWIHYLTLRYKEDTQLEHRQIANSIRESFIHIFPIISRALKWVVEVEEEEKKKDDEIKYSKTNIHPRKNTFSAPLPESINNPVEMDELSAMFNEIDGSSMQMEAIEKATKELQKGLYSI
jgi:thymidylate synthase (FAD)